jgi:hypothetical protein
LGNTSKRKKSFLQLVKKKKNANSRPPESRDSDLAGLEKCLAYSGTASPGILQ